MKLTTRVERGRDASRVLVLLHGLGGDEHDLESLVPTLDADGRFVTVLPRGPYPASPGFSHGAWFMYVPTERTIETLNACLAALEAELVSACLAHRMRPNEAVIGGFSQGGATAIAYAFHAGVSPAAVFSVAGVPPRAVIAGADIPTKVRIMHGRHDADTPLAEAKDFANVLKQRGASAEFAEYDAGHELTDQMTSDLAHWLAGV